LGSCGTGVCNQVSVAYWSAGRQLDVAVSDGAATRIEVFPVGADGDALPTCTISGSRTRLARTVVTGIAVSPTTGTVYVMAKSRESGGKGRVDAFSTTRCGNVAPVSSFGDRSNGFADAMGIAVGP
jgi:DNA-binding beta-propeller fold protein YncE